MNIPCWMHCWISSRTMDLGKSLPAATQRHFTQCEACRGGQFKREQVARVLAETRYENGEAEASLVGERIKARIRTEGRPSRAGVSFQQRVINWPIARYGLAVLLVGGILFGWLQLDTGQQVPAVVAYPVTPSVRVTTAVEDAMTSPYRLELASLSRDMQGVAVFLEDRLAVISSFQKE